MCERCDELYDEARDARSYSAFLEKVIERAIAEIDRADTKSNLPWLAVMRMRDRMAFAIGEARD